MSTPKFTAPETPVTREEVYYDAILRGLNGDSPAPVIPTPVWRMEEYLAAIAEAASSGGSSLPPVTSSDNGKVLAVKDGAWAAGMQEYWIPVEAVGTTLSIPADKGMEVALALNNAAQYFVRGIKIGTTLYAGYVENTGAFIVPLAKSNMSSLGYDCAGKIHIANNSGVYAVTIEPDKFIVTLTPTSPDYSGTMDKTVAEINAAYEAGQEIVFRVLTSATEHADFPLAFAAVIDPFLYMNFGANFFYTTANTLIVLETGATDDGTSQTYSTAVYSLTPAS